MKKKFRGFTLIELVVVIAIIGILAMIIVPLVVGYITDARITRYNSNAKSVLSGCQLALVDANRSGVIIEAEVYYTGESDCLAKSSGSSPDVDLKKYLGESFDGYFGFITNKDGYGADFAIWSDRPVTEDMIEQITIEDMQDNFKNGGPYIGCSPLLASP